MRHESEQLKTLSVYRVKENIFGSIPNQGEIENLFGSIPNQGEIEKEENLGKERPYLAVFLAL